MEYIDLAWYGMLITAAILVIREARTYAVKRLSAGVSRAKFAPSGSFNGLTAVVHNSEEILGQLYKMRDEMVEGKATPEALKPVEGRIKYMETVKDWRPILEPLAPHIDGLIDTGLTVIKRIAKSI